MRRNGAGIFKKILQAIRIFIGLGLLYFALKDASWTTLKEAFQSADLRWLLLALALVLAGTVLKIWRWSQLLGNFGICKGLFNISRAYLVGQAANILLPFRGGEVIRSGMLAQLDVVQISQIAGTIVIEKSLDLLALTTATLLVFPSLRSISDQPILSGLIVTSGLLLFLLMVVILVVFKYWTSIKQRLITKTFKWKDQLIEKVDQIIESCHWMKEWKKVTPILLLTLLTWFMMWLTNLPIFRSVNLPADPRLGLFILVLVYIGLIPALTPGNIAPFYFFAQLGLVTFKFPKDEALAFAILLHTVVTLPILIAGGVSLLIQNKKQAKEMHWSSNQSL